MKIGGETIRNIPFQYASAAITMSIHQITQGKPPAALMRPGVRSPTARPSRRWARRSASRSRTTRTPTPRRSSKLLAAIHAAEVKADAIFPRNTRDRIEADRYLKALHGLIAMLQTPAIDVILAGAEKRPDATLGELLNFMSAFNLRFGAASTPQQRMAYESLYPKLVELRNEVAPALASSAAPAPALPAQEAGEFFSGMSYEDLKKKAPQPPAANAPQPPAPNARQMIGAASSQCATGRGMTSSGRPISSRRDQASSGSWASAQPGFVTGSCPGGGGSTSLP